MSIPARRILIPADLSPVTSRAAAWARRFASRGACLEALFAHDTAPAPLLGLPALALSKTDKKRVVARLEKLLPSASLRVEEGDPAAVILRRARAVDLVVMGSHARRGLDRAVLGSTVEAVARDCPVPVLAVRAAPAPVRSVLAPVNLMPYSYKGLLLGAEAAAHLGAVLTVLHVAAAGGGGPNPRFFLNGMIERLPKALKAAVRPRLVRRQGHPVREILAESSRHGLVALTAHRKSLLSDLVLGTTAERVLRHCGVPVLTAPSGH